MEDEDKGWLESNLEGAEFRRLFEREMVADDFIAAIESVMDAGEINRTELARRMGCALSNVTRAMRSSTNMTLSTMVDMALALGQRVKIALDPIVMNIQMPRPKVSDVSEQAYKRETEGANAGAPASIFLHFGGVLKRERRFDAPAARIEHG